MLIRLPHHLLYGLLVPSVRPVANRGRNGSVYGSDGDDRDGARGARGVATRGAIVAALTAGGAPCTSTGAKDGAGTEDGFGSVPGTEDVAPGAAEDGEMAPEISPVAPSTGATGTSGHGQGNHARCRLPERFRRRPGVRGTVVLGGVQGQAQTHRHLTTHELPWSRLHQCGSGTMADSNGNDCDSRIIAGIGTTR